MELPTQKLVHTFGALADLGQEITDSNNVQDMVLTSLQLLTGALAIRRSAIFEYVPSLNSLRLAASRGIDTSFPQTFEIDHDIRSALLAASRTAMSPDRLSALHPKLRQLLDQCKYAAEVFPIQLFVPMAVREELVGVVLLGKKATEEPFSDEECEFIQSMVRHVGVGIHNHRLVEQIEQRAEENRRLYDELRTIYRDTVRAFAAAIDIKDKYTQGHSERVGKYSEVIARELGWSEEEVEGIQIAGYLHDIGKLIVDRDIINAPYHIDAKNSSELNRHPSAGYEILAPIRHPYADIPLMAKHHHERLDGRGYPDGLTDKQIPIGAKIVSLADSFDAMTTDRPYKRRRSFEDVVVDLRENSGKQFDGKVVAAFARAILKEVKGETRERRITKMLGKPYLEGEHVATLLTDLIMDLGAKAQSSLRH